MTWTPAQGSSSLGRGLTDKQRAELGTLERAQRPTPWDRGALDALRMSATDPADSDRVAALLRKWADLPRADQ